MSPRIIISDWLFDEDITRHAGNDYARADSIIEALRDAGFVIIPKEPNEATTDHETYKSGEWSRRNVEAYIRAVTETVR